MEIKIQKPSYFKLESKSSIIENVTRPSSFYPARLH